ncbi:hypothetical protein MKZ38_010423 [Zalerion maritima]|uniref:1-phosphatidylinositol-3-phosphate 5-kinase n=1 Tax=Zalerion maritima TaxID=339359 RepID=A0AAD5RTY2_9PEZI|nr:hypothetical protein MKZ38_010423 [Zalerion maritima]
MSGFQTPTKTSQSPALSSLTSVRSRRGSIASVMSSCVDKQQLAQQLDKIHNSASQSDALTTFNDFAPPPNSSQNNIVDASKGIAGDIVQTGFSGLYSRFKEAVGVSSKQHEGGDLENLDSASKKSTTTVNTISRNSDITTPSKSDPPSSAHGSTRGSINPPTSGGQPSAASAGELLAATTAATAEMQSQISQVTQSSSSSSKSSQQPATSSRTGSRTVSAASSKHSLAALALASAAPAASLLTINVDSERGRPGPGGVGAARISGNGSRGGMDGTGYERPPHVSYATSPAAAPGSPIKADPKITSTSDGPASIAPLRPAVKDDHGAISISSNHSELTTSPVSGQNTAAMLPTLQIPSANSSGISVDSTSTRKPAIINRITRSRSPVYPAPRTSSLDLGLGAPEASNIHTSAHNTVYHESFSHESQPQQTKAGGIRIPGTTSNGGGGAGVINSRLQSVRNKMLSKDFWMADETCNECFACQIPFTAWRRKHHCRTCGRIFDSNCTAVIPAQRFGLPGNVRVCKICQDVINKRLDDNSGSDDSADDEATFFGNVFRPNTSKGGLRESDPRASMDSVSYMERSQDADDSLSSTTPMMAIAATRRMGDKTSHSSAVLEIGAAPQLLSRPSSSRSLKSLAAGRPQSSAGHKRHHSKNLLTRFKVGPEERDRAPFRKSLQEDPGAKKARFPAFHDDNVIDPDLAPFMSDESSGDEQISISAAMENPAPTSFDPDKATLGTYLSAGKKHRMRQGEKSVSGVSFTSRGGGGLNDNPGPASLISHSRSIRRARNLSIAGGVPHHMRSPRPKSATISVPYKTPTASTDALAIFDAVVNSETSKLSRSDSVSKPGPASITLGPASMTHVKRLLRQLFQDYQIPSPLAWEKALVPLLLRCTDDIDQDIRSGDDIDIRHYVKLKKIPGAKPADINYVSGVIFTKKLALKSMPRSIPNPRIVLVSFAIEYQRHQQQHFMSLQPVIEQEKEFLRVIVSRIRDLHPHVLFAEKNVSGIALQYLNEAGITVAYNVKRPVIEALSRCCRTEIISSIDMLAIPGLVIGGAGRFDVKTYVNNDYPGRKNTYIFVSGCDKTLGCTIALRGASTAVLARMKRITEFMVYVVYNLKLESCFMADSFIQVPSSVEEWSIPPASRAPTFENMQSARPQAVTASETEDSEVGSRVSQQADTSQPPSVANGHEASSPELPKRIIPLHESHARSSDPQLPEDVPMPTFYSDVVAKYKTKILSASPFVKFAQPYLLMKAREQERKLVYLRRLRDQDVVEEQHGEELQRRKFQLIRPEMVHEIGQRAPKQIMEVLHAAHDAEYDKALYNYQTQTRQWENSLQGTLDLFDPFSHQSIAVLYSVTCTESKIPCIEPSLVGISFYDELHNDLDVALDPDCTLGQYIEDLCLSAEQTCTANGCGKQMIEHHRTYVHDEARITVFVFKENRKTENDKITMWSYCKLCRKETEHRLMSESTWKYSFGKFLELSFWCQGLTLEDNDCPHDYHREHLRYFGFRDFSVRIHYDPIDLLEVIVPRVRITWKVDHDLKLKNNIFTRTEERWNRFMNSVKARLATIRPDSVLPEKVESCTEEVAKLAKKASEEQSALIGMLQGAYVNTKYYEVIPMNGVIRGMLEKAAEWDATFAQFEADFLPDKDMRQITVLQLKKMFTDSKESVAVTDTTTLVGSETDGEKPTQSSIETDEKESSQPMSEKDTSQASTADQKTAEAEHVDVAVGDTAPKAPLSPQVEAALERVEPLDLATPSSPSAPKFPPALTGQRSCGTQGSKGGQVDEQDTPAATPSPVPASPAAQALTSRAPIEASPTHVSRSGKTGQVRRGTPAPKDTHLQAPAGPSGTGPEPPKPIPERGSSRNAGGNTAPPIVRAVTQPSNSIPRAQNSVSKPVYRESRNAPPEVHVLSEAHTVATTQDSVGMKVDKKLTDRLVINALKGSRMSGASSIPRFVGKKKDTKVSTLAKHFEQLSREFEKERMKNRKDRASRLRDSRAFLPRTSTKAVVEVYNDVDQAVEEQETSPAQEEQLINREPSDPASTKTEATTTPSEPTTTQGTSTAVESEPSVPSEPVTQPETPAETDNTTQNTSTAVSDDEESEEDDADPSLVIDEIKDIAGSIEVGEEVPEFQKHQKSSLMKIITNFWAERSASSWPQLEYPLNTTDHIFMDSDIIVREDEPSSLISFALSSDDYEEKLADIRRHGYLAMQRNTDGPENSEYSEELELEQSLLKETSTHLKYQFQEGSARMLCKIFYAEQFDTLRRKCGVADRIVESLSRCLKWDSKGGKTKSVFLKTLDDRLVMKSLSPVETAAFLRFAPAYFNIMAEALFHDLPSVIAKMLGFFQISIKNPMTGTDLKLDLLLMENLFYDRSLSRIFDLKGSMRNRKIEATGEQNEVLLDENMVEYIYESPLFAREHSKKIIRASVWNDTLFLARQDVMDYSLMIAIDEKRQELVVGIIDCIRTYTWDKKLESWIKDRGFAGGGRNRPTITGPKEYKTRFREAMARYILEVPDSWHQFPSPTLRPRFD